MATPVNALSLSAIKGNKMACAFISFHLNAFECKYTAVHPEDALHFYELKRTWMRIAGGCGDATWLSVSWSFPRVSM